MAPSSRIREGACEGVREGIREGAVLHGHYGNDTEGEEGSV